VRKYLRSKRTATGNLQPPMALLELSLRDGEDGENEGPAQLNDDTRYWGEPDITADGTEGNSAYYKFNMLPVTPSLPKEHQKYWRKSPYWNYFKSVWGDAPMADTNFELWMRGFFKDFTVPRHPQEGQTTRGLPAWLHYYSSKYDPLVDPPYVSDFALFATEEGAEAAEKKRPDGLENGGYSSEGPVFSDCSEMNQKEHIDRPCGVRTAQRYAVRPYSKVGNSGKYGLDKKHWTDARNMAGPIAGTPGDESLKDTYIKVDKWWANAKGDALLPNMPPPPEEPPALGGDEGGGGEDPAE